eukprot:1161442-Pelagomonas_calceolata.AAC.14
MHMLILGCMRMLKHAYARMCSIASALHGQRRHAYEQEQKHASAIGARKRNWPPVPALRGRPQDPAVLGRPLPG